MRNEKEIMKQNDTSTRIYIKFALRVAVLALCTYLIYKIGASSIGGVVGGYILFRSVLKMIRLTVNIFFSLLTIFFLIVIASLIIVFIF